MAEKDELRTEFPQIYPHFYHILHWSSCNLLEFILFFLTWLLQRWQHSELLRIEFTNSFCFQQNSTDNAFVKKVHFPLPLMPVYRHPIREGNGTPLQYSCLENPTDGGAWWAAIHGIAKSRTRLKRLSSSSIHWVGNAIQSFHLLSPPSPTALNLSQHQALF